MDDPNAQSIDNLIVNYMSNAAAVFKNGEMIRENNRWNQLISDLSMNSIVLSEKDLSKAFNLAPLDINSTSDVIEKEMNGKIYSIKRNKFKWNSEYCTLIEIENISARKNLFHNIDKITETTFLKIRSGLSSVFNVINILIKYTSDSLDKDIMGLLKGSQKEILYLSRITYNIRELLLIQTHDLHRQLNNESLSLDDLIDEALEEFKIYREISEKRVSVHRKIDPGLTVYGDKKRCINIIHSILINSLMYSGNNIEISLSAKEQDSDILLYIKDNGIGIPSSDQQKIFEYGFRGSNINQYRETGLGIEMFLAQKTIRKFGGRITFISKESKGSVFEIILKKAKIV